jgi:hypothetical protein
VEKATMNRLLEVFDCTPKDTPSAGQMINLFCECKIDKFLPWACYLASKMSFVSFLRAPTHGKIAGLFAEDVLVTLHGRHIVVKINYRIVFDVCAVAAEDCHSAAYNDDTMPLDFRGISGACTACLCHWRRLEEKERQKCGSNFRVILNYPHERSCGDKSRHGFMAASMSQSPNHILRRMVYHVSRFRSISISWFGPSLR